MKTIFINGKFSAQVLTGVQRSAVCTLAALDGLLSEEPTPDCQWVLLCMRGHAPGGLQNIKVRELGPAGLALHLWEQFCLPWASRGAMLLNLAGSAPLIKRRQVCTIHDAAVFDWPGAYTWAFALWYRMLFRRISHTATAVLTVSEFCRGRLMDCLGIAAARVFVAHGSGDHMLSVAASTDAQSRWDLGRGDYFIAVGSSNPTKNFAALIAAFESLASDCSARLVIVGGGNDAVFRSDGQSSPCGERIVRTGRLEDADLKALYGSALGLVFPSLYEGFGLPLLEAMSCGCPVIASNAASIPEVCGDAALYFDPRSQADIAGAMQRLADDPALRARLRSRGTARAQTFSWKRTARLIRSLVCCEAPMALPQAEPSR